MRECAADDTGRPPPEAILGKTTPYELRCVLSIKAIVMIQMFSKLHSYHLQPELVGVADKR